MELFSEIYGCYYTVVARVLAEAYQKGLTKKGIEEIVSENAFYDSAFHLLPKIYSGEWAFLQEKEGLYHSKLAYGETRRPLSRAEKAWIKALLFDPRIGIFANEQERELLLEELKEIAPLYEQRDFHMADVALDQDPYDDMDYQAQFRVIAEVCKTGQPLRIEYEGGKGNRMHRNFYAWKIIFSQKDNKFRLLTGLIEGPNRLKKATLNLARIKSVVPLDWHSGKEAVAELYKGEAGRSFVVLEITKERNALERCMLQFASWEKETEDDEEKKLYLCRIYYDKEEETELLIRILGFGPVVKVTEPAAFVGLMKERIQKQAHLQNTFV